VNNDLDWQARKHIQNQHSMDVIFKMRLTLSKLRICNMTYSYGDWRPFVKRYRVDDTTN
jgi:hypothetical protein